MSSRIAPRAAFALAILSLATSAAAEPIRLNLAYFSSDRTATYRAAIKPFVDAINADPGRLLEIEVAAGGALGKNPAGQLEHVLDGTADIAFIVPGYTPDRFLDNKVIELPGLFNNVREATLVFTRLMAADALRGYEDLVVLGAVASEPESIHARTPIASLDDLQGKRVRTNNPIQAAAVARLGMTPVQIPINKAAAAISAGELDGAAVSPSPLVEFGIARVAPYHYLLGVSSAPLAIVMNRKTFERLPGDAQDLIGRYSGEWLAEKYIRLHETENKQAVETLRSDPKRSVILPSRADRDRAEGAFTAVIEEWRLAEPRNSQLLAAVKTELDKLRSGQ